MQIIGGRVLVGELGSLRSWSTRSCSISAGLGLVLLSTPQRRFWLPEFDGSELNLAGSTKKLTGRP